MGDNLEEKAQGKHEAVSAQVNFYLRNSAEFCKALVRVPKTAPGPREVCVPEFPL